MSNKTVNTTQSVVTATNWQLTLAVIASRDGQRRLKLVYQLLLERSEPVKAITNKLTPEFSENENEITAIDLQGGK